MSNDVKSMCRRRFDVIMMLLVGRVSAGKAIFPIRIATDSQMMRRGGGGDL